MATDLTNLPTVGGDENTWGTELNEALVELDTNKASISEVYTKNQADARYVRTVNDTEPDENGNVTIEVSGDGGGSFSGVPNDGSVTDAKIAAGGLSPTKITGTAVISSDSRLTNARTPTAHKSSHVTGGSDAIAPSDIGAMATSARGAASGVAPLGVDSKVPTANLPAFVAPGGTAFKLWVSDTAPTVQGGAKDGDLWVGPVS